jgi:hypothetical protein
MQNKSEKVSPRKLSPMSASGLSKEARKAVDEAFEAMSTWCIETADVSEKNSEHVIEKMAAAARVLGWPEQIVEATRAQLQSIAQAQVQTMDQVMDAWEEQIKLPNPATASPSDMLSKLTTLPSFGAAGSSPTTGPFQIAAMNPFQAWLQFMEQWQKLFEAMTYPARTGDPRHRAEPHQH